MQLAFFAECEYSRLAWEMGQRPDGARNDTVPGPVYFRLILL